MHPSTFVDPPVVDPELDRVLCRLNDLRATLPPPEWQDVCRRITEILDAGKPAPVASPSPAPLHPLAVDCSLEQSGMERNDQNNRPRFEDNATNRRLLRSIRTLVRADRKKSRQALAAPGGRATTR